jgi:hypothetical protein
MPEDKVMRLEAAYDRTSSSAADCDPLESASGCRVLFHCPSRRSGSSSGQCHGANDRYRESPEGPGGNTHLPPLRALN